MRNWELLGHGHYCVTTNGFIFSHSDPAINHTKSKIISVAGDELNFLYDRGNSILKISKGK